ncbi:UPF0104 family protein [Lawsonia intracellularis]|uniref:lysylphosphatidylglycerol synthase transmembrane domain-containing protein n=1 Tax=Lawsonia intracellularis TaxID=29546 RepID=UPI000DE1AD3F|nr:lysylphosphatidylglycerol synthase transmembrane domain-containing protein [Lawsonia intracellularis]RBN32723.1 UPF0104 family protein [Lawsonia intracellularis]RBN33516.1 UPF0104 family protein [Lawsonia intracellularis]UYH53591.1 flippase-like domain-containing protein [Lawsonia intracellularis]
MQQISLSKRQYSFLAKVTVWLISILCFIYAIYNVNIGQMWTAIKQYSMTSIVLLFLFSIIICIVNGLRKYFLFNKQLSLSQSIQSAFFGLGGNNIFPAKAGEFIHAFYIARVTGKPNTEVFPVIFMERFADINLLAILSLFMLSIFEPSKWTILLTCSAIAFIWLGILLLSYKSSWIFFMLRYIPWEYPRNIANHLCSALHSNLLLHWMIRLFITTILVWVISIGYYYFAFTIVAKLDLTIINTMCASFILCFGAIIPSSPGSLGVFEASAVFALGLFGVPHSEALAIGLVCHFFMFFVPVAGMVIIMSINKQVKQIVLTAEQELKT